MLTFGQKPSCRRLGVISPDFLENRRPIRASNTSSKSYKQEDNGRHIYIYKLMYIYVNVKSINIRMNIEIDRWIIDIYIYECKWMYMIPVHCAEQFLELKICISPRFHAIDPWNPARGFIQQNENVRLATAAWPIKKFKKQRKGLNMIEKELHDATWEKGMGKKGKRKRYVLTCPYFIFILHSSSIVFVFPCICFLHLFFWSFMLFPLVSSCFLLFPLIYLNLFYSLIISYILFSHLFPSLLLHFFISLHLFSSAF